MERDLCESICSNFPAETWPLTPGWWDPVQCFWIFLERDHNISGQPLPVLSSSQLKCFQMFRQKVLCFTLRPLHPFPRHGTVSGSGCSLHPPFGDLFTLVRARWDLQDEPFPHSQLRRDMPLNHLSGPFLDSFLCLVAQNWTQNSRCG